MPDTLTMVLIAVGSALVAVSAALWPLVAKLLTRLIDNQENIADMAQAYMLLAKAHAAAQSQVGEKLYITVIEDTPSHRKMIRGLLLPVCAEAGLELAMFADVDDALYKIPQTRLLILDVVLDSKPEVNLLNRLIGIVPDGCDVIIHAAHEYRREDFPQVVAILKKWGDGAGGQSELVTECRKALRLDKALV